MKIALTSDIHLEFGDWYPVNPENADVLILGGDIMLANEVENALYDTEKAIDYKGHRFIEFLHNCVKEYKNVIYVMGNHEHYHGDFAVSTKVLGEACEQAGVHFLDKNSVKIDDITFIGGTLWTDMNNEDSETLYNVNSMMNDFRVVQNGNKKGFKRHKVYKKNLDGEYATDENGQWIQDGVKSIEYIPTFSTEDALEDHKKMMHYIDSVIYNKFNEKFVVVGHHAPSKQSTHPRYKDDTIMNGGYSSDLTKFILKNPQIKAWTHGHTHDQFDYMVGSTRVLCNPRGYVHYERDSNEKQPYFAKVFEV